MEKGREHPERDFKGENSFLKICLCAVGVDILNWSWEWTFFFFFFLNRKKEMQGWGAASSRGSSQATCHGAIYRAESQQGCSGLE